MFEFNVDFTKCNECEGKEEMNCERLLPGFRSVHGGRFRISKTSKEDREERYAADDARLTCPKGALSFRKV